MVGIGEWISAQAVERGTTTEEVKRSIVEGALALRRKRAEIAVEVPGIPIRAELPPATMWEHPLLKPFGVGWTTEEKEAYPLTPEGMLSPAAPIYSLLTAPGEKVTELLTTTTVKEIQQMEFQAPGIALPGIGEIKLPDLGDIAGGLKNTVIIAAVAIGGIILLSSFLKGRKA